MRADLRPKAARAVRVNRTYEPNPVLQPQYAEKAALYAEVYPTLAGLNRKLVDDQAKKIEPNYTT